MSRPLTIDCPRCSNHSDPGCEDCDRGTLRIDDVPAYITQLIEDAIHAEHVIGERGRKIRTLEVQVASRDEAIFRLETTVTAQLAQIRTLTAEVERLRGEGMKVAS